MPSPPFTGGMTGTGGTGDTPPDVPFPRPTRTPPPLPQTAKAANVPGRPKQSPAEMGYYGPSPVPTAAKSQAPGQPKPSPAQLGTHGPTGIAPSQSGSRTRGRSPGPGPQWPP